MSKVSEFLLALDDKRFDHQVVGVIYGGQSAEREISLKTGRALAQALREAGLEVTEYDWPQDMMSFVQQPPKAALLAMHSGVGEDGTLQGFLEIMGVPYTGSGVLATALAMDKSRAKAVMAAHGVELAQGAFLGEGTLSLDDVLAKLAEAKVEYPFVFKPNDSGSSCGVHICKGQPDLIAALEDLAGLQAQGQASGALVERVLSGPEYSVGFFGAQCLGAIKITPADSTFYDYHAKYQTQTTRYEDVDGELAQRLEVIAVKAWAALGCRGVGRVDVMGDVDGSLCVLEVNTIPGMTATSLVPKLATRHGLSFPQFAARMICSATTDVQYKLDLSR